MIVGDQRPPGADWLVKRVTDLERLVRELIAGRALEAATIGKGGIRVKDGGSVTLLGGGGVDIQDGGSVTVNGGGDITVDDDGEVVIRGGQVLVEDDNGDRLIWLGQVPFGDGTTKPGLVAFRSAADGGAVALSLYDGIFAVWDRQGHIVLSTDEVSGQGIARPWLPIPFAPSDYIVWPGTASASFARVLEGSISRQQPKVDVLLSHTTDVPDTTGEVRLMCNGTQLGPTVPVGFVIAYTEIGPLELPDGEFGEILEFTIEARRTAGTGKVRAMVSSAWSRQS